MSGLWSCLTITCLLNLILSVTDGLDAPTPSPRVCVIGAGYSGLATSRYLKENGVNYTVFEATRTLGGTWRFDPHVGVDEDGLPLFTSMYKQLRTNTPRQTMEFAGFPFPDDTPAYPAGPCFYKYLQSFAKTFDLEKNIQYRSLVNSVKWSEDHWSLSYLSTVDHNNHTESCDFVVVASGYYCEPKMPDIEGLDTFKGRMIHSHDYKEPSPYVNRKVLVVGAGPSGLDLVALLSNVTSKLLHSHHLNYNAPNYSNTYVKKPDILSFTKDGAIFVDGSFEDFDDVILCTGYLYNHPFLDDSTGITKSSKYILPLYRHMVNIKHPSMIFVGIPSKIINRIIDAQAEYAARLVAGLFKLPTQEAMLKSWLEHVYNIRSKGLKIVHVNQMDSNMDNYFANLTAEAGVKRAPPVLTTIRDFNGKNRLDDWLNYRDYEYNIIDENNYERKYNPKDPEHCTIEV